MCTESLLPILRREGLLSSAIETRTIYTFGLLEGEIDNRMSRDHSLPQALSGSVFSPLRSGSRCPSRDRRTWKDAGPGRGPR